ncbi:hypothetical protein OE88DRAFT_1386259 [Heliocybe sulcata]|uniref:Uncharacterized protein n=1 Tax=Heliocybe sulcata TaxID=5364 RepID=A0A5C3N3I2_9AGAM|nr:hypothetical protein OE88DRAFT_1386259 [Heliocybe sulcata]
MTSANDLPMLELRGPEVVRLRPGGTIRIDDEEYEYFESSDDESIDDDRPVAGRMVGKLIKRLAAPVEMFLDYCSDLAGKGPNAIFTRLVIRVPQALKNGHVVRRGSSKPLSYWTEQLKKSRIQFPIRFEDRTSRRQQREAKVTIRKALKRLVKFTIDRRYPFQIRLTASYYLVFVLLLSQGIEGVVDGIAAQDALLRISQEGSRQGTAAGLMHLPQHSVSDMDKPGLQALWREGDQFVQRELRGPLTDYTEGSLMLRSMVGLFAFAAGTSWRKEPALADEIEIITGMVAGDPFDQSFVGDIVLDTRLRNESDPWTGSLPRDVHPFEHALWDHLKLECALVAYALQEHSDGQDQ